MNKFISLERQHEIYNQDDDSVSELDNQNSFDSVKSVSEEESKRDQLNSEFCDVDLSQLDSERANIVSPRGLVVQKVESEKSNNSFEASDSNSSTNSISKKQKFFSVAGSPLGNHFSRLGSPQTLASPQYKNYIGQQNIMINIHSQPYCVNNFANGEPS